MSHTNTHDLLSYYVPKLSPDGSCSIIDDLADEPYDLRAILCVANDADDKNILEQIRKLHSLLENVQKELAAEWIGIYQRNVNADGVDVLVKLAYQGIPSRAEFPLTEEFAKKSNNSTVGISGRPIVIDSVKAHDGAYYKCDSAVNSEACLPVFETGTKNVIGIVDAEAFAENYFTDEKLKLIETLCVSLSEILPIHI